MLLCFLRNCKEKCTPVKTKWKNQNNFGVLFEKNVECHTGKVRAFSEKIFLLYSAMKAYIHYFLQ